MPNDDTLTPKSPTADDTVLSSVLPPIPGSTDTTSPSIQSVPTDVSDPVLNEFSAPSQVADPFASPSVTTTQVSDNSSVLNPPAVPVVNNSFSSTTPPAGNFGGPGSDSPHVPQKYGGKKVMATIFGVLLLVGAVAAGVILVQRAQDVREQASSGTGNIAIFKFMCDRIGQQDVCNGRDISLSDYKVDFKVHSGVNDQGPVVQTITVTLSDNNNGQGNTGNGSQGRKVGDELDTDTYTVCEIPIAYNATGDRVPLEVEPRPEASHGGSSGGTNQTQFGSNCITVVLNPGEAELKYLDKRQTPVSTPTPTAVQSPTPTPRNHASNTPTSRVTATPIPTLPPDVVAQCLEVKTYKEDGSLIAQSDLSKLKPGDKVRFAVKGQASSGSFSKARFTVNNTSIGESTQKNTSDEYYLDYTIPAGTTTFTVRGEVLHSSLGWI